MSASRNVRFCDLDFAKSPHSYNEPNRCYNMPVPSIKEIKETLETELQRNRVYKSTWSEAMKKLKEKKRTDPSRFDSAIPDECYIAVIAYTMDRPLYQHFNYQFRMLKSEKDFVSFPYRSFYYLLTKAKNEIKNCSPNINQRIYRGMDLYHFDPPPQVGEYFYFDSFSSSSVYEKKATGFIKKHGTLITLENGATDGMGMAKYSDFPEEGEVLIFPTSPGRMYQVVGFQRGNPLDNLRLRQVQQGSEENVFLFSSTENYFYYE